MANLIQIKRSTTNATPAAGGLRTGELAYSLLNTSNSLFVGDGSNNAIRVGGGNYLWLHQANTGTPGALTANAVVIVNGNSFVTNWKTNGLTVGTDGATVSISNISTFANTTQLGGSAGGANTELVTSWAIKTYIDNNAARLPNTYVAFGANSVANGGINTFTFDSTTATLTLGNTTVNTTVNATAVYINTNTTGGIVIGNSSVNTVLNSASIQTANGKFTGTVNTVTLSVSGTTTTGNTIVSGSINATSFVNIGGAANLAGLTTVSNNIVITGTANVAGLATVSNNLVVTGAVNAASLNVSGVVGEGNTTVTGFINVSSYARIGGDANVAGVLNTGNTTITGFANVSTTLNVTGNTTIGANQQTTLTINSLVKSNIIPTDGSTYNLGNSGFTWATLYSANVVTGTLDVAGLTTTQSANVTTGLNVVGGATVNGALTVNNTAATGNLSVTGTANATVAVYVGANASINTTAFRLNGSTSNVTITSTTVGGNATATLGNTTINGVLTATGNTVAAQINATSINVSNDLSVGGNLTVSGTLTTINTTNLNVSDPLISLANGNATADISDIGFYGAHGNSTVTQYTGLFRKFNTTTYKLFDGLSVVPTTTVDTTNASFTYAMLQSQLSAGGAAANGFIANATTIALTANSTLNVAIVANTLTLSTALAGTSGGTGLAAVTAEDILVANSTNGFRKLSVGSEGYVLQVSSGVVAYNTLDGGTF